MPTNCSRRALTALCFAALLLVGRAGAADANPYRGLWVGRAKLGYVNEVSIPVSNSIPLAPDPKIPTPTSDAADLRLILHVNAAGQVSLLKDVAVLNRRGGTNLLTSESDLALVTDETLYGQFPPQPAQRIASAAFDFGDSQASDAVDAVIDAVVAAVTNSVATNTANLSSAVERNSAENAAAAAARQAARPIATNANVAAAFDAFLRGTNINALAVDRMASSNSTTAATARSDALAAATNLQNLSFFLDTRGIEMVLAISNRVRTAANGPARTNAAQNTAASFADVGNEYQRFITGDQFGGMINQSAAFAASAVTNSAATIGSISSAATNNPAVSNLQFLALSPPLRTTLYRDTRATDAITTVTAAVQASALSSFAAHSHDYAAIQNAAAQAGFGVLATNVVRYALPSDAPTPDYNAFVISSTYLGSPDVAAAAAAAAAVQEKKNNVLYTLDSLANKARIAALQALDAVLSAAARAVRHELPMDGTFKPGAGDARLTWAVRQTNAVVTLLPAALTATISLPANHPTNPFRHRRHPDHTTGFDITRNLRLDFDPAPAAGLARAGFGVDRVSGIYREEIFGLHKPLGPQKDIGLKVEGTFELSRISLIDTLNAR